MRKALIIGTLVIGISALTYYLYSQVKKLSGIKYTFGKPKIQTLSLSRVSLSLPITFTNTSDISLTLKSAALQAFVNDSHITDINSTVIQVIPKNGTGTIWANIDFVPNDVLKGVATADVIGSLLTDRSNIKIRVTGDVDFVIADNLSEEVLHIDIEQPLSSFM